MAPGRSSGQRGTVLVLVLLVAVTVGAASLGIVLFTSQFTRRQANAVHDQRAFYLAEAALSEAYTAVTAGQSGQIGSIDRPAASGGDGIFWVDATRNANGSIELRSTALSGLGRSSLSLTVERVEQPLGVFAANDLVVEAPLLVDGYDSSAGPYETQVSLPSISVPQGAVFEDDPDLMVLGLESTFYEVVSEEDGYYTFQDTVQRTASIDTTAAARAYFDARRAAGEPPSMVTTSLGGQLGSNGSISLSTSTGEPVAIFGDLIPGPGAGVAIGGGVTVTGRTASRSKAVMLDPVEPPEPTLQPGITHGGAAPLVLPAAEVGYQSLRIESDADLIVRGPSRIVVGQLELKDRAALFVENLDGPVDLFVLQSLELAPGSILDVASSDPADLTLQIVGTANPVQLASNSAFHGMVYGPEATLRVEAPFEIFGALIGGELDLGAGVRLHYDGGIAGSAGRLALPKLVSWDVAELPPGLGARRINPIDVLAVTQDQVQTLADATVSYSWTAVVEYESKKSKKPATYEGPFEEFVHEDVENIVSFTLVPPDETFGEDWTVEARYKEKGGDHIDWTGRVADYPVGQIEHEDDRTLIPPPSLAALGYEPVTYKK